MLRKTLLTTISLCLAVYCSQIEAQVVVPGTQGPSVVYNPYGQNQIVYPPYVQNQVIYPSETVVYPGNQIQYPGTTIYNPPLMPYRPSVPQVVTPNTVTGYNPQTGGLNTANTQFNNTFFDPLRNQSQFNNRRWVQRPVYSTGGQVIGYEQGWVWNNAITGQEHGNLQTYTPNQTGGVHEGQVLYSRHDGG
jgi:hypothetical protein